MLFLNAFDKYMHTMYILKGGRHGYTEDNYVVGLQAKNEKALKFFIEHDGWIVKSIVHKMMAKYQDKQEECMNDIFLAVWKNVDRYTGEKASFRTWLTAVARYQVLSHIRDIRYHDYVSLDDVEPVGDSDVKSRLFDEEEMLEFQKLLEILSEEDRQIFTALFWHEKSYEEVGQEMNMPVDRVYSRVSRGKKKLKKNNRWLGGSI